MTLVLLTGGSGQVGKALIAAASARGFTVVAPDRAALDLANGDTIRAVMASQPWDIVINCGAYTAVDKAESEPGLADAVNHIAPGLLAAEAATRGIPIIHVSTDYVFDGSNPEPYQEADATGPTSVYGGTKLAGEVAVRAANPRHAIIRTAWIQSADGANFINTMLRLGEARAELGVVDDQLGCPTSATDLAHALLTVATDFPAGGGTFHFVNSGEGSWHGLADFIFTRAKVAGRTVPKLNAITTTDYPTPARRPANSRLDTNKFETTFGVRPRHWHEAIGDLMDQRLQGTIV